MSRITFGKKSLNCQNPRVDRFVTSRDDVVELSRRRSLQPTCHSTIDIWYAKHVHQRNYTNYLGEQFGLEPTKPEEAPSEHYWQPWPCVQRKKKYMSSADSVLDLPSYSKAVCYFKPKKRNQLPELLDWSCDNILVAALERKYYKWSWRSQSLVSEGVTQHKIQCCKFDPRGEILILGTDTREVEIHNNAQSKWVSNTACCCAPEAGCSITALDWSPTGNSFITGCSRGYLVSFCRERFRLHCRSYSSGAILIVRISPDARYVAAVTLDEPGVLLLVWPSLEHHSSLNSDWIVKTIAWHPWRSALLGVGAVSARQRARLVLWDTPPSRVRDTYLGEGRCSLDGILFSHRTGELVLSAWNPGVQTIAWHPWRSALLGVGAVSARQRARLVLWDTPPSRVRDTYLGEGRCSLDGILFSHRTGELVLSAWNPGVQTIAWHPWRSALLGVGAVSARQRARLVLWDTPPSRVRDTYLGEGRCSLDGILFSHRTGELVLSAWNPDMPSYLKNNTQLVVMSDPWTVVDQWGEGRTGLDRIRTMVFSPDGTKLATATIDEDLIIWNFLPEDKDKSAKKTSRRFSAIPLYLDQLTRGYSFR